MYKYQVYGLGNALVDKEFEVTDDFLQQNNIEKGLMTLIEEDLHVTLLDKLTTEFGLKKRVGGGSAANSLVALAQFGGRAFLACKVGDDETGQFYVDNLKQAGVDTRIAELDVSGQTGKCMVMVTSDAERTMNTYLGITADFSEQELFLEELPQAEYLYIEGYLVTSDKARAAIIKARQAADAAGIKVAMTFSDPAMVKYFKEGVEEVLGDKPVDILFCNAEEATTFAGEADLDKAATKLLQRAKQVAITCGADGACVYTGAEKVQVAAPTITPVDSNGAGDMFAGAYLYAITQNWNIEKAALFACASAAEVVKHFGPRISKESQQELLAKFN
ncbi:adenosine kinase [Catenovulum sediminis]|uniref:Adenosine kinase n=1 Tax=Catenovulum sediminis TaxID=1740262 RepID=A0ABV1RKE8_9ALTE|nr:adenosine kinase [Catenovulum sediminis]